jgi:uncharacterized protein (TIGR03435 family)
MVQTLLAEQFHIRFHCETCDRPVFLFTVAGNGRKIELTPDP